MGNVHVCVFIYTENSFQNGFLKIPQVPKLANIKNNQKEVIQLMKCVCEIR